jgi:hypothetical protein
MRAVAFIASTKNTSTYEQSIGRTSTTALSICILVQLTCTRTSCSMIARAQYTHALQLVHTYIFQACNCCYAKLDCTGAWRAVPQQTVAVSRQQLFACGQRESLSCFLRI